MNGAIKSYKVIFLVAYFLPLSVQSQSRTINGIIKELHADKENFAKPVALINILFYEDGKQVDARFSKEGGLFSFSVKPNVSISFIDLDSATLKSKNYIIVDDEPFTKINWKEEKSLTKDLYILICKKDKLENLSDDYRKRVESKINEKYNKELTRLLKLDRQQYIDTIKALKIQHEYDLASAKAYSEAFSKMEFKSDSDILYRAFAAYLDADLSLCEKYLETNNQLIQITQKHETKTGIIINSWLILAEIKEGRNDSLSAEDCYSQAIRISTNKYNELTYGAFANYLLKRKDYSRATKYLTQSLNSLDSNKSSFFDKLVYTYYQLSNAYSLDKKDSLSLLYAENIIRQKEIILKDNNERNYSLVIAALNLAGNNSTIDFTKANNYLTEELNLVNNSPFANLEKYGWVDNLIFINSDIGDLLNDNNKINQALPYYLKSIEIAKKNLIKKSDTLDLDSMISDLNFAYELVWTSKLKRRKQLKYFQNELEQIKIIFADTIVYNKMKEEIQGIIDMIKEGTYGDKVYDEIFDLYLKQQGLDLFNSGDKKKAKHNR